MAKIKTFVDASVLIAAFRGNEEICRKAMEIIDDPEREFIVSDYLKLEVIPKPTFFQYHEEVMFMQTFINNASMEFSGTPFTTSRALTLACQYGLNAIDALHAEVAIEAEANVLITIEKSTKPLYRIQEIQVKYI